MHVVIFLVALSLNLLVLPSSAIAENHPITKADLLNIETLQRQTHHLEFQEYIANPYALYEAQAWLDFAQSEYYDADHSGIVQAASLQAKQLLAQTQQKSLTVEETSLPLASEQVRLDLWQQLTILKQHTEHQCIAKPLAQLKVQLIWAGHEQWESGALHAEPYIKAAENMLRNTQYALAACIKQKTLPMLEKTPIVAEQPIKPIATIEKISIETDTLFAFNQYKTEYLIQNGKEKLQQLLAEITRWKSLTKITLIGHADALGTTQYNQKISLQRAEQIKQYLTAQGLAAEKIIAIGLGENVPIVQCIATRRNAQIQCLQPNRRVVMMIEGEK